MKEEKSKVCWALNELNATMRHTVASYFERLKEMGEAQRALLPMIDRGSRAALEVLNKRKHNG